MTRDLTAARGAAAAAQRAEAPGTAAARHGTPGTDDSRPAPLRRVDLLRRARLRRRPSTIGDRRRALAARGPSEPTISQVSHGRRGTASHPPGASRGAGSKDRLFDPTKIDRAV